MNRRHTTGRLTAVAALLSAPVLGFAAAAPAAAADGVNADVSVDVSISPTNPYTGDLEFFVQPEYAQSIIDAAIDVDVH